MVKAPLEVPGVVVKLQWREMVSIELQAVRKPFIFYQNENM